MINDPGQITPMQVDDYLNNLSYTSIEKYVPSAFALAFVNFIKLVEGGDPENKTPVVHFKMIDSIDSPDSRDVLNMCHRGFAKSTIKEYLILYLGVFHALPLFGEVPYALYISDSIDNGVKKMRKSLEFRYNNSTFLQSYMTIKLTDTRWEFVNKEGKSLVVSGFGAKTGVRGTRENGSRPVLALLDDLISDSDARSATVIADVEDTVYKAIDYALHPKKRKIIWSGTPFNAKDPLYKAVNSGAWLVNVYPVCEKFPCTPDEFKGSWEDRFDYEYVQRQYEKAKLSGKIDTFNQELMLRIMSEDDRLVTDHNIKWYSRPNLLRNLGNLNIYITTDFATSEKESADFSSIAVWGLASNGMLFLIDGVCKRQLMDANLNDLFRLCQMYSPLSVGVEITGQQGGFIQWIKTEMISRNIFFNLAQEANSSKEGIRPTTDKMTRFHAVLPWFKAGLIHLPTEEKNEVYVSELVEELSLATFKGFKSKHDDCIDTLTMLQSMNLIRPSGEGASPNTITKTEPEYLEDIVDISPMSSYTV